MKVAGFGVVTTKGLDIIDQAILADAPLEITDFYATTLPLTLEQLADPSDPTFGDMTRAQLEAELVSHNYYTAPVSGGEQNLMQQDASYLPLLLSIISNDYEEDMEIHTIFILAKEPSTGIEHVIYMGCPAYDEVLDMLVDDASPFAPTQTIQVTTSNAQGQISAITGDIVTFKRDNIFRFNPGETITNGSDTAVILSTPTVNLTASTLLPVPYLSDGADIVLRTNLRSTSGFPRNITFLNTAIAEIEAHNANDGSHLDIRLLTALYTAQVARDVRDNKDRMDALVHLNGLIDI